jgi:hypothetical protein
MAQGEIKNPSLKKKKKRWLGKREKEMAKGKEVQQRGESHVQKEEEKLEGAMAVGSNF